MAPKRGSESPDFTSAKRMKTSHTGRLGTTPRQMPADVIKEIVSWALPAGASQLRAQDSKPHTSTLNLRLINKAFNAEVCAQLYYIRPLEIYISPPLVPYESGETKRKDIFEGIRSLKAEIKHQKSTQLMDERKSQLARTPFHLFRRIDVHFIP